MIIGLTPISGCVQAESFPAVDLHLIQGSVGKSVTVEGCLQFACPTITGARYPEDCLATLCDENHNCINNLEFSNSTDHLRNTLDDYYAEVSSRCVRIAVKGTVEELACPVSDQGCVTTYRINVIDLTVMP